jgi:hypothetical protein
VTITEFLLARIEEDEVEAQKGRDHNASGVFARDNYGYLLIQPARVLAECAAKRAIIALHPVRIYTDEEPGFSMELSTCLCQGRPCSTLQAIAAVYADHPDYYRQEWAV